METVNLIIFYNHHFKYANWKHWFHIQRKRISNVNMSVPKSHFGANFGTYVFAGVCFWHFRELKSDCWTSRHLLCEKNIKLFRIYVGLEFV